MKRRKHARKSRKTSRTPVGRVRKGWKKIKKGTGKRTWKKVGKKARKSHGRKHAKRSRRFY